MNFFEKLSRYADGAMILRDWVGANSLPVSNQIAQERADICLKCPSNAEGMKLTEAIAAEIKRQVEFKNHLELRVDGEKSLHSCDVCQCVNRLQIWLPDHILTRHYTKADAIRYPDFCWKRKLMEAQNG